MRWCFARGRGGKSWRKLVSACALALVQILYKVPLKVTKGNADEHADYGVNVCVCQASVFTSLITSSVDC